jgi:hypothetical protein
MICWFTGSSWDGLPASEPGQVRDKGLDQKDALRGQVPGHILKAADLFVLGQQDKEGVDKHIDQGELSLDGDVGEIAKGDQNALSAGLGPELGDHRFRGVDPVDLEAALL